MTKTEADIIRSMNEEQSGHIFTALAAACATQNGAAKKAAIDALTTEELGLLVELLDARLSTMD